MSRWGWISLWVFRLTILTRKESIVKTGRNCLGIPVSGNDIDATEPTSNISKAPNIIIFIFTLFLRDLFIKYKCLFNEACLRDLPFFNCCVISWKPKNICVNAWNDYYAWCVKSLKVLREKPKISAWIHKTYIFCVISWNDLQAWCVKTQR